MSLDKMKKQAKNLLRLLPDFVREHPNALRLADCQELVARSHGFPNWHAAVTQAAPPPPANEAAIAPAFVVLPLSIQYDIQEVSEYTKSGKEKPPSKHLFLRIEPTRSIDAVDDALNAFMEKTRWDTWEVPPADLAFRMVALCERLIAKQPAFLDGFAHLAVGLIHLGRNGEVITRLLPVYEAVVASFPDGERFDGRIKHSDFSNRPFHRIAANLVVAAYRDGTPRSNALGSRIAKQMYRWWPNDNVGFRFMLTADDFERQTGWSKSG